MVCQNSLPEPCSRRAKDDAPSGRSHKPQPAGTACELSPEMEIGTNLARVRWGAESWARVVLVDVVVGVL